MREYGQIQSSYWTHPNIQGLSHDAKLIGAYLLTSQHTNGIGCFRLPIGYVSIDLGMGIERVSKGFQELFERGFSEVDERSGYVLIPSFLKWNPIHNPNSALARVKEFDLIPHGISIYPNLIRSLLANGKYFTIEFKNRIETLSKGYRKGIERVPADLPDNQTLPRPYPDPNPDPTTPTPSNSDFPDIELKNPEKTGSPENGLVEAVFSDWQQILNHPRARLGNDRRKNIVAALKIGYQRDELKDAFVGCSRSSFHMGLNAEGKIHSDIPLILRNESNIDRFRTYRLNPPKPKWRNGDKPPVQVIRRAQEFFQNVCREAVAEKALRPPGGEYIDGDTGEYVQTGDMNDQTQRP